MVKGAPLQILDPAGVAEAIAAMARDIQERFSTDVAIVGIRRGGEHLAHRLAAALRELREGEVPVGMVDISLYRDDGFGPNEWPTIGSTEIDFDVRHHEIHLVDDVLYTGRTVRAAMDAILDFGRPKAVRLSVLVDRGCRELPVQGDVVGLGLDTTSQQHVDARVGLEPSENDGVWLSSYAAKESGS